MGFSQLRSVIICLAAIVAGISPSLTARSQQPISWQVNSELSRPIDAGGQSDYWCDDRLPAPGELWQIRADALWLRLERDKTILVQERQGAAAFVNELNTNSAPANYEPAIQLALARRLDDCTQFELGYYGLHHWSNSAILVNSPPNTLQSTALVQLSAAFASVDDAQSALSSRLHNAHLGLRREFCGGRSAVRTRVRYIRFEDDLQLTVNGATPGGAGNETTTISTENDLVGVELSFERNHQWRRVELSAAAGASLMLNFNRESINDTLFDGVTTTTEAQIAGDALSLAGIVDISLISTWRVTDGLALRGGYQALLASGMATAADQITLLGAAAVVNQPVFNPSAGVNDGGALLAHGFFVGVDAQW